MKAKPRYHYQTNVDKTRFIMPSTLENACAILNADATWRKSFEEVHRRYNVPPALIMAFIYQESSFKPHARAETSTAYGYAQALDATWGDYLMETGNYTAKRSYLPDAIDFVGWYVNNNFLRTGVPKNNPEHQYLGYHEGSTGYLNGTFMQKDWLMKVAKKVQARAQQYNHDLQRCYFNS